MIIFVIPILIGYIIWRHDRFDAQDAIILTIATAWPLLLAFLAMCKVRLTDSEIEVSYIVPFRKGGVFNHTEIESYAETIIKGKGKTVPMLGMLQPKGKKSIMILNAGTEDFNELNALLKQMYSEPKKKSEPVN
jgi:hypothetical protein